MFSPLTQQLMEALRRLPSVGPKTAQRMAFEILSESGKEYAGQLAKAIEQAIARVGKCEQCQTYTEETLCNLCNNPKRNPKLLCLIETPADIVAIEQANMYNGLYYVLHGHLSPLDGIGPKEIGIPKLIERLHAHPVEELILATNPTMEGKATANYIVSLIDPSKQIKCTRIAHGVPIGGELEYLDSGTLTHAFYSRIDMTENPNR